MPNLFSNKEDQEVKIGKPEWLKTQIGSGEEYRKVKKTVKEHQLNTICESGKCPNQAECWNAGTATFMILGNTCTRSCQFCNVNTGKPEAVDPFEPARVAKSIQLMGIKHELELKKGSRLYLFSDGYLDQFGGDKGKKLKSKNLKEILLRIQHLNIDQQEAELRDQFVRWKGNLEQLDDVCIIGIEV